MTGPELPSLWCVYIRPRDYPNNFVARKFVDGKPTSEAIITLRLEDLRGILAQEGLVRIPRDPEDEPQIVESWI